MEAYDEIDAFKWSKNKYFDETPQKFKNCHNDLLIAHPEECIATFESVNDVEDPVEPAKFYLHAFREPSNHKNGVPVAISFKNGNKNYLVCATSDLSINIKESRLPNEISSKTSEFIFYQKEFSVGHESFRFESSLNQGFFLAYSRENCMKKLVLKHCPEGIIDETIKIYLENIDNMPEDF